MIILGFPCRDCGAPSTAPCDESCPSAVVIEHELVLAEIDAAEDHAASTYPDERKWAS